MLGKMENKYLPYVFAFLFGLSATTAFANPDKITILGKDKTKKPEIVQTQPKQQSPIAGMEVSTPTAQKNLEEEICTFTYTGKSNPADAQDLTNSVYGKASEKAKNIDETRFKNWLKTSFGQNDVTQTLMYDPVKGLYFKGTDNTFYLNPNALANNALPSNLEKKTETKNVKESTTTQAKVPTITYEPGKVPRACFGLIGSAVHDDAKTSVYDYEAKGQGLGINMDMENIPIGKNYFLNCTIGAITEDANIYNVLKNKETGTMKNTRKTIDFTIDKELKNLDVKGGVALYNYDSIEERIPAESSARLAGINYGIDYTFSGTPLTIGYEGQCLGNTGGSNVEKITMSGGKVKVGPMSMGMKTRAIQGDGPVVQQLAQQGIFPSEINAKWEGNGYSLSFNQFRNYETCASAWGCGGSIDLTKDIELNYTYSKLDRDSKDKKTASERSMVGVAYVLK